MALIHKCRRNDEPSITVDVYPCGTLEEACKKYEEICDEDICDGEICDEDLDVARKCFENGIGLWIY